MLFQKYPEVPMSIFPLAISILLWGVLHSLLASFKVKELVRRLLGETLYRFYRLGYNFFAGISFLFILVLAVNTPDHRLYTAALPWSVLMVLVQILSVVVLVIGIRQTDAWELIGLRQLAKDVPPARLTTGGLYRHVRHPLYTAGMVFIWLMPVMTVNILVINAALTIYTIVGALLEERKLSIEFGQEYAAYAADTPMFIPFIKGNRPRA
jgi:protein-S-isoprenylcysteine O-methyltransferase Ste14